MRVPSDDVIAELAGALPAGVVVTDPDVTATYRQDWARDPNAGLPRAVVRATSTADVQTTMRWATRHQVAVVPRGAGSGLSGGSSARADGIVLSLEKMRDIHIDTPTRTAVVQPGLLNVEVKKAAAEFGLWYPPDPSSFEICSIGGNVATNAGGSVLREVRRHHRLRARPRGRAGRRHGGAPGRPADQGRGRAVADQTVRRLGGHCWASSPRPRCD